MEKIVETKNCKHCGVNFDITDFDLEFYDKVSPNFNGIKYQIPSPTLCPNCRSQRRLSFRNENKVYKNKCKSCDKGIISMFSPDKKNTIFCKECWYSDKWNPIDYGKDFDFSRPFFEQIDEILSIIPIFAVSVEEMENSDYSNNASYLKNCYLCFNGGAGRDCLYCIGFENLVNSVDCLHTSKSENCYQCVNCVGCNKLFFSQDCTDCNDSYFLKNCIGCSDCIGSANLVNKKYCIYNKEYSKDEYFNLKDDVLNEINKENNGLFLNKNAIHKNLNIVNSNNSEGNYIFNGNNIKNSFDILEGENVKYSTELRNGSYNVMDIHLFGWNLELSYDSCIAGNNASKILFSFECYNNVSNLLYCTYCVSNVKNCFGCVGLKDKEYCILNKQYTKEEYETLVPKIINHMIKTKEYGEFFPSNISPFGYNETVAQEYYPLSKEQILRTGPETSDSIRTGPEFLHGPIFNYSTYEPPTPHVSKTIPSSKLPDNIKDIPDDILNWAIIPDENVGNENLHSDNKDIRNDAIVPYKKPFRIIKQELEFYKKHNIPIPKKHPDQRHLDRMKLRNPRKLYDRNCDKCNKEIKTTYNPEREEIVYCEQCYNKEIY